MTAHIELIVDLQNKLYWAERDFTDTVDPVNRARLSDKIKELRAQLKMAEADRRAGS